MVLVYAEEEESLSRAGDDFGEELGEEVVLEWLTLGSARHAVTYGWRETKTFQFHLNTDPQSTHQQRQSQTIWYGIVPTSDVLYSLLHMMYILGSHEERSGNDLIRWYPCVQFLSYLTSGRNHLGYGREKISKSQDVPWVLPSSSWKAIWWELSLLWSPLVCLSSWFGPLWPTHQASLFSVS